MEPLGAGIVLASLLNGLRHGLDVDHIAAIGDIVSAQADRRRSFWLASTYAGGHAAIVFVLGVAAILVGARLPAGVDEAMSKVVGLSLLLLGLYVFYSFARYRSHARLRSRWQLASDLVRRLRHRDRQEEVVIEHAHDHVHDAMHSHDHAVPAAAPPTGAVALATRTHVHTHQHVAVMPTDPLPAYGCVASFGIGILHGIGAETPTQLLLFLTAAGVGTMLVGISVLTAFVIGMLASNAAIAIAFTFGTRGGAKASFVYPALALATALFSVVVGLSYLRS